MDRSCRLAIVLAISLAALVADAAPAQQPREARRVTRDYDGVLADAASLNGRLRLLWIGIGRDDFLFTRVRESREALQKAGIDHVWVESDGAHVWTEWREHLADFAPRLFR
jgi:enterochelin esterase family protein